jgi:hypothetical protein
MIELPPHALERMYDVASRNHSDIVLGKMAARWREPITIFRRSVESATLAEISAIDSLTGHKMFRRAFLNEHGIRFPKAIWRMEDLLFVTRAYVHNPQLSVVADEVCYWWHERDDWGQQQPGLLRPRRSLPPVARHHRHGTRRESSPASSRRRSSAVSTGPSRP